MKIGLHWLHRSFNTIQTISFRYSSRIHRVQNTLIISPWNKISLFRFDQLVIVSIESCMCQSQWMKLDFTLELKCIYFDSSCHAAVVWPYVFIWRLFTCPSVQFYSGSQLPVTVTGHSYRFQLPATATGHSYRFQLLVQVLGPNSYSWKSSCTSPSWVVARTCNRDMGRFYANLPDNLHIKIAGSCF